MDPSVHPVIPLVVGSAGYVVGGLDDELLLATMQADFELVDSPVWGVVDGNGIIIPGSRAVFAGDVPLGIVGNRWHPVQNIELLDLAQTFSRVVNSRVEVGGVTPDRRRTWFWIPLEPGFSSIVSTAHDGRGSVSIQLIVDDGDSILRVGHRENWLMSFPHGPTLKERFSQTEELRGWTDSWLRKAKLMCDQKAKAVAVDKDFIRAGETVVPLRGESTARKESTRRDIFDRVASRWTSRSEARGTRLNKLDLAFSWCWYLDHERDGHPRYLADQALEDSNWVARTKTALWEEI